MPVAFISQANHPIVLATRAYQALRPDRGRCAGSLDLWWRILRAGRPQWRWKDYDIAHGGWSAAPRRRHYRDRRHHALADPIAAKQVAAWLSDGPLINENLTPFEYLEFVAGLWRIDAASPKRVLAI